MTVQAWEAVEPVLEFVDGWSDQLYTPKGLDTSFQKFIKRIETYLNVPVDYISLGAERNAGLFV